MNTNQIINEHQVDYLLNEEEKTAYIIGHDKEEENFFIPRSIEHESQEYIVKKISSFALSNSYIHTITFPYDTELRIIEKNAFEGSELLYSLTLPSNVELEEEWCSGLSNLNNITIIPKNEQNIKYYDDKFIIGKSNKKSENFDVLHFCRRDIKEANIPSFIRIISRYAFYSCDQMKIFKIPPNSSLEIIEKFAFSQFETVSVPSNFECINGWTELITRAKNVIITPSKEQNIIFLDDKFIVGKSDSKSDVFDVLHFCKRDAKIAVIPPFIKHISSYAFYLCKELGSVEILPDSQLEIIDENAFIDAIINNFTIPSKFVLRKIWQEIITQAQNVTITPMEEQNIEFYDDLIIIGKSDPKSDVFDVLHFCKRDAKIAVIPPFIKRISSYAFDSCEDLEIVEIPSNSQLEIIDEYAFSYTSIHNFTIPPHLIEIGDGSFRKCKFLENVEILSDSQLRKIGKNAFQFTKIHSFTIPSHLTEIGEGSFQNCYNLEKVEFFDDSELQVIGSFAFTNSGLKTFSIPHHVTSIGEFAFSSCKNLKNVEIPSNSELCVIEKGLFKKSSIEKIFIPNHLTKICEEAFCLCKNLRQIDISPNSELEMIGKGAFFDTSIEKFTIPPHLTKICEEAFFNCEGLQEIKIQPNSKLETIEDFVFHQTSVKSLSIPSNFEFKLDFLQEMKKLTKIKITPMHEQNIKYYNDKFIIGKSNKKGENFDVLHFCRRDIKEANIPSFIRIISSYAFYSCDQMKIFKIPPNSSLEIIEKFAFANTSIQNIFLPP